MQRIFILALSIIYCVGLSSGLEAQEQEWKNHSYSKAGFSIKFPSEPRLKEEDRSLILQAKNGQVVYQVAAHYQRSYDLQKASQLLKESVNGFINIDGDTELSRNTKLKINGNPAYEVKIKTQDGLFIIFRTMIMKDKLFQFVITKPNSFVKGEELDNFLNSFQLR